MEPLIGWDDAMGNRGEVSAIPFTASWPPGPKDPHLGDGEVHVWLANLDETKWDEGELGSLLSVDERLRAEGFRRATDRRRYIAVHGILRHLLAAYVGLTPQELEFAYTPAGKPSLASVSRRILFNLSQSDGLALFAFSLAHEVGVDIESITRGNEWRNLVAMALTATEAKMLIRLPQESIPAAFIACWTAKEAYLKARGVGLKDLQEVEVALTAAGVPQLRADGSDPYAVVEWGFIPMPLIQGYQASLAVRAGTHRLACWCLALAP